MPLETENCGACACYLPGPDIADDHPMPHLARGWCRRFPEHVQKRPESWCFEFAPKERPAPVRGRRPKAEAPVVSMADPEIAAEV